MVFYYLFPERVERMVLVASGGLGREVNPILRSATLPGAEWVLPVLASGWVRARAEGAGRVLSRAGWQPGTDITAIWHGFTSLRDKASHSGIRRADAPFWPRPAPSSTQGARRSTPTTTCPTPRRSRPSSSGAPATG